MWLIVILAATGFFAAGNVLDSLLIQYYEKRPVANQWSHVCFTVVFLAIAAMFVPLRTTWLVPLVFSGVVAFLSDMIFVYVLNTIDVSLVNIAWALQTVFISLVGLLVFRESWSFGEDIGVVFIFVAVGLLSLWRSQLRWQGLLWLALLGLLNGQSVLVQKAALLHGELLAPVFFWTLFGREAFSFLFPWVVPKFRKEVQSLSLHPPRYFQLTALGALLYFLAFFLITWAYSLAPASLVATVNNAQPFMVLFFAWLLQYLAPRWAARETLTKASITVKIVSFGILFAGLAFLAFGQ